MLVLDGIKYDLVSPKNEEELQENIRLNSKDLFGKDSIYFDLKQKLTSKAGVGSLPDGYVLSLSKPSCWYVVEAELSKHPLHEHITNQLNKFLVGLKNPNTQRELVDALYNVIDKDRLLRVGIESKIDYSDINKFLWDTISKQPKIVVIIDEKGDEVKEACDGLKIDPTIIEFKTYVRKDAENVRAHLFDPLPLAEKKATIEVARLIPDHYKDWDSMLRWVDDNVRTLVERLNNQILRLGNVAPVVHGRYYCFYAGKPATKTIFAVFLLTKPILKIRIRTKPDTFRDPQGWTGEKIYKGWFFKSEEEREFRVSETDQIDYAVELIKQAFELTRHLTR